MEYAKSVLYGVSKSSIYRNTRPGYPIYCMPSCTCVYRSITYRIVGFYREDFNITFGSICNIKIRVIFVNVVFCKLCDIDLVSFPAYTCVCV